MSAESSALATFHACKRCTIAMYVKLWTCFHCKLDSDTLSGSGLFCCGSKRVAVDAISMDNELENRLRRSAPKGYRGESQTARGYRKREAIPLFRLWVKQIVMNDMWYMSRSPSCGMGLFARRTLTFDELRNALVGWLSPVSDEDFRALELAGHPSLLRFGSARYILIGPLSLVNHHCKSRIAFGKPKNPSPSVLQSAQTPEFVNQSQGDCKMLQIVNRSSKDEVDDDDRRGGGGGEEQLKWQVHDQILVYYGNDTFEKCLCDECGGSADGGSGGATNENDDERARTRKLARITE